MALSAVTWAAPVSAQIAAQNQDVKSKRGQGVSPIYEGWYEVDGGVYALNANVELPATASRDDLLKAMQGKVVAKAAYVGRFRQDAK